MTEGKFVIFNITQNGFVGSIEKLKEPLSTAFLFDSYEAAISWMKMFLPRDLDFTVQEQEDLVLV